MAQLIPLQLRQTIFNPFPFLRVSMSLKQIIKKGREESVDVTAKDEEDQGCADNLCSFVACNLMRGHVPTARIEILHSDCN